METPQPLIHSSLLQEERMKSLEKQVAQLKKEVERLSGIVQGLQSRHRLIR